MTHYYLSLGSNIAPEANLAEAVRLLQRHGTLVAASTVFQTTPLGAAEGQPDYLNAAVILDSDLDPKAFHSLAIEGIEKALGRVRTDERFAPRPIDIDIMLVEDRVLRIGSRIIPSPEILSRRFVALALAEIDPDRRHPLTGETLAEIAARFDDQDDGMQPRPEIVLGQ